MNVWLHVCAMKRWMVVAVLAVILTGTAARGQSVGDGSANLTDLLARRMGPPTPKALQEERLRQLVGEMGMPGRVHAGSAGAGDSSAMALPDITQTIPTTTEPKKLSSSLQILLLMSVLTLAPSILLMTTCFTRIVIVMSLLRQALGASQLPPNQILIGLSLFMTFLVMGPTWSKVNAQADAAVLE